MVANKPRRKQKVPTELKKTTNQKIFGVTKEKRQIKEAVI